MKDHLIEGHEKILVVDDQDELLDLAQEYLKPLGYQVSLASDGWQALDQIIRDADISLLFSDVVMPGGMNGYELAQKAIETRSDLKILLTSGYPQDTVPNIDRSWYKSDILGKPYTQLELASEIRAILDKPEIPDG